MYQLSEIAQLVQGNLSGHDLALKITGAASLEEAGPTEITFAAEAKMVRLIKTTKAAAVVVSHELPAVDRDDVVLLRVQNARLAWAEILDLFAAPPAVAVGVHDLASVMPEAVIGDSVSIQAHVFVGARTRLGDQVVLFPGVYVGADVVIGAGTVVYPNAVILDGVEIGENCLIHPGAVVGSDGFGYVTTAAGHRKVQHIGKVVIEDDVEIGANSTVDKATTGVTRIGRGTKIDNLVQVGHNVQLGTDCLVVALSGLAGSSIVEERVVLAGQSGVAGHLRIGKGTTVASRGLVAKDIPAGSFVSGFPARPHSENMRLLAAQHRLPELLKSFTQLQQRVKDLEEELEGRRREEV